MDDETAEGSCWKRNATRIAIVIAEAVVDYVDEGALVIAGESGMAGACVTVSETGTGFDVAVDVGVDAESAVGAEYAIVPVAPTRAEVDVATVVVGREDDARVEGSIGAAKELEAVDALPPPLPVDNLRTRDFGHGSEPGLGLVIGRGFVGAENGYDEYCCCYCSRGRRIRDRRGRRGETDVLGDSANQRFL